MAIRVKNEIYYVYYRDMQNKLRTLSLRTKDKAEAQQKHDAFMKTLSAAKATDRMVKRHGELFTADVKKKMRDTSPVPEYHPRAPRRLKLSEMLDVARKHRKLSTGHVNAWKMFTASQAPRQYADEITPERAQAYLDCYYGKGNGKTYNNNLTMLNVIFKACLIPAHMTASPFATVPRRIVEDVEHFRPFTADEFRAIFAAAAEPWKTAALISWHTAFRRETCFRLSWSDIDEQDRSITIMPGKTARFGRAVYVPIHPELWQHLNSLTRPTDPLQPILGQWRRHIDYNGDRTRDYFAGLLHALHIEDTAEGKAGFHSLRASFITRCDEAGVSRRATRGIAGHAADDMTDLYSHDRATAKQILDLPGVLENERA